MVVLQQEVVLLVVLQQVAEVNQVQCQGCQLQEDQELVLVQVVVAVLALVEEQVQEQAEELVLAQELH